MVTLLQHARALSVNNTCTGSGCTNGLPHGVHIETGSYTLFQGATYTAGASTNAVHTANTAFNKSGSLMTQDVVFSQLAGTTTCTSCDLLLTDGAGHSSTITVTPVGQIVWTH